MTLQQVPKGSHEAVRSLIKHLYREKVVLEVTVNLTYTSKKERELAIASAKESLCSASESSGGSGGFYSWKPRLARLRAKEKQT